MRYSLLMVFLALTVCAIVAGFYGAYLNDPVRRLTEFGAVYRPTDEMEYVELGPRFDRSRIDPAVSAIRKLEKPCSISVTCPGLTDVGIEQLQRLTNVPEIHFDGLSISNDGLFKLAEIDCLKRLTIERCWNLDNDGIVRLDEARPDLTISGSWKYSPNGGGVMTGR